MKGLLLRNDPQMAVWCCCSDKRTQKRVGESFLAQRHGGVTENRMCEREEEEEGDAGHEGPKRKCLPVHK